MFTESKYLRIYRQITSVPDEDGYTELHHILPRSMGGTDSQDNLVRLSARKHFLAHWLLTKITTGQAKWKMLNALNCMRWSRGRKLTSWQYAVAKRAAEESSRTRIVSDGARKKIGDAHRGKTIPQWHKDRVSQANKGRVMSQEHRARMSAAQTGKKWPGRKLTEEHKAKVSASLVGNTRSVGRIHGDETKLRMSKSHLSKTTAQSNSSTGLKGVHRVGNKFRARTRLDNKYVQIGMFDCPAAAHFAYVVAVRKHLKMEN